MRAAIQRVKQCSVKVDGKEVSRIGRGILALIGINQTDVLEDADYLLAKIVNLRIFEDLEGKLNLSLKDINGELMIISQFTLYGDCRKGRRPSFTEAAPASKAESLYNHLVDLAKQTGLKTETGVFQALMEVELINYGPVTLLLDSQRLF